MFSRFHGLAKTTLFVLLFLSSTFAQNKIRHPFDIGKATIDPTKPVAAGSFTTITYTYDCGNPINENDFLKVVFRSVEDFGTPQFYQSTMPNYCTLHTTGNCRIEPRWDGRGGHPSPFGQALFLQVKDGFLDRGEKIVVVFGDTSKGSPGWQIQTWIEKTFEFKTFRVSIPMSPISAYELNELPESPTLRIISGTPARAVCIAPSQVVVNEKFTYHLRLDDEWGNPTDLPRKITHPGFSNAEVKTIEARDKNTGLSARSNPVRVLAKPAALKPYWAELQSQTEELDVASLEEYFIFARDYAILDISSHQSNDPSITDDFWEAIKHAAEKFYEPGAFVTLPGYEWSANSSRGGHRNVYYLSQNGEIYHSRSNRLPEKESPYKVASTPTELFQNLNKEGEPEALVSTHYHSTLRKMHDPRLERVLEIHSGWGTFEWLLEDYLRLGYRIGVLANNDGHRDRPGGGYPSTSADGDGGAFGGLGCVLAQKLDRKSIFEAMKARHFYGTTGIRALVDVKIVTADGRSAMMGDVISNNSGTPHLYVNVIGTAPIENVEVRNGLEVVKIARPYEKENLGNRVKIVWGGAEGRGDYEQVVSWDGSLHVQNNSIKEVTAVNFWNAFEPLKKVSKHQLEWKSRTFGNVAGVIVTLDNSEGGLLEIETLQHNVMCEINSIGLEPKVWKCGGLNKKIEAYCLPDEPSSWEYSVSLPLTNLHEGDNPIYIRMTQEDGQIAWTSPVYLVVN